MSGALGFNLNTPLTTYNMDQAFKPDPSFWTNPIDLKWSNGTSGSGGSSGNLFEGILNNVGSSIAGAVPGLLANAFGGNKNPMAMVGNMNAANQGMSDISFAYNQKLQPNLANFTAGLNRKINIQAAVDQPFFGDVSRAESAKDAEQQRLLGDLNMYNNVLGDPNLGGFSQAMTLNNPGQTLTSQGTATMLTPLGKQLQGTFRYLA